MPGLARVFDPVKCDADLHGWVSVPIVGMFSAASSNVLCNSRGAVRAQDGGSTVACPGPNSFSAIGGAFKTLINGRPAIRENDATMHCGNPLSLGKVMQGLVSPNTIVGS